MIALANDHSALELKEEIKQLLEERKIPYKDFGTNSNASCHYPIFGARAARAVAAGECEKGILLCGTGLGIGLVANKVNGIRCAICSEPYTAKMSRAHNDANMIAIGARVVGADLARMIIETWLDTPFEGGRHQVRVDLMMAVGKGEEIE